MTMIEWGESSVVIPLGSTASFCVTYKNNPEQSRLTEETTVTFLDILF